MLWSVTRVESSAASAVLSASTARPCILMRRTRMSRSGPVSSASSGWDSSNASASAARPCRSSMNAFTSCSDQSLSSMATGTLPPSARTSISRAAGTLSQKICSFCTWPFALPQLASMMIRLASPLTLQLMAWAAPRAVQAALTSRAWSPIGLQAKTELMGSSGPSPDCSQTYCNQHASPSFRFASSMSKRWSTNLSTALGPEGTSARCGADIREAASACSTSVTNSSNL